MSFQELAVQHHDLTLDRARVDEQEKLFAQENPFLAGLLGNTGMLEELDRQRAVLEVQAYDALNEGSEGLVENRIMNLTETVTGNPRILQAAKDRGLSPKEFTVNLIGSDQRIGQVLAQLETENEQRLAAELIAKRLHGELFHEEDGQEGVEAPDTEQVHTIVVDRSAHSYALRNILQVGEETYDLENRPEILAIVKHLLYEAKRALSPRELFEAIGEEYDYYAWNRIRPVLVNMFGDLLYDAKKRPHKSKNTKPKYIILTPEQRDQIDATGYDESRFRRTQDTAEGTIFDEPALDEEPEDIFEGPLSTFAIGQLLTHVRNAARSLDGTEFQGLFNDDYDWILDEIVNPKIDRVATQDDIREKIASITDAQLFEQRRRALEEIKRYLEMPEDEYRQETDKLPEDAEITVMYFHDQTQVLRLAEVIDNKIPGFEAESRVGRGGNVVESLTAFLMDTHGREYSLQDLLREHGVNPANVNQARAELDQIQRLEDAAEDAAAVQTSGVKVITINVVDERWVELEPTAFDSGRQEVDESEAMRVAQVNIRRRIPNVDAIIGTLVGRLKDRNALGSLDKEYPSTVATTLVQYRQHVVNQWFARATRERKGVLPLGEILIYTAGLRHEPLRRLFEQVGKKENAMNQAAFLAMVQERIEEALQEQEEREN